MSTRCCIPPASLWRRMGWYGFQAVGGRPLMRGVCRAADTVFRYDLKRSAPVLVSENGTLLLRPFNAYGDLPYVSDEPWCIDGVTVDANTPVFEIHIVNTKLVRVLRTDGNWQKLFEEAFHSLALQLNDRAEKGRAVRRPIEAAIVATTTLRREARFFGFCARAVPQCTHYAWDMFFRRLYLFAYHPDGAQRVLREYEPLVQIAISVEKFCRKYG